MSRAFGAPLKGDRHLIRLEKEKEDGMSKGSGSVSCWLLRFVFVCFCSVSAQGFCSKNPTTPLAGPHKEKTKDGSQRALQ